MKIKARIFIVGCPRSGTTILQSSIAQHPQIMTFFETQFFVLLVGQTKRRLSLERPGGIRGLLTWVRDMGTSMLFASPRGRQGMKRFLSLIDRDDLLSMYPRSAVTLGKSTMSFVKILDSLAMEQGKQIWLEKTPRHVGYINVIERYVPKCYFIHIIRRGEDVVASNYDVWMKYDYWKPLYRKGSRSPVEQMVDVWNKCYIHSMAYRDKSNHLLVYFEEFVDRPEATLTMICKFLNIDYDEAMRTNAGKGSNSIVVPFERWKAGVHGGIRKQKRKFDSVFSDEQRKWVTDHLIPIEKKNRMCS